MDEQFSLLVKIQEIEIRRNETMWYLARLKDFRSLPGKQDYMKGLEELFNARLEILDMAMKEVKAKVG